LRKTFCFGRLGEYLRSSEGELEVAGADTIAQQGANSASGKNFMAQIMRHYFQLHIYYNFHENL
jgi:hypothetical protein